jgi:ankyrin repeat protein
MVKIVYNAYPQAIHVRGSRGFTSLGYAVGNLRRFLEAQVEWERQAREQRQPDERGRLPIHRLLQSSDVSVGTVELMISQNLESATTRDNQGFIPLHYACKFGHLDVAKFLVDFDKDSLKAVTLNGDLPLHIACREGKCSVINWIMGRSDYGVSLRNKDGKLPIELLLCGADVDRHSLEYVEAMNHLLRSNPGVLECLAGGNLHGNDRSRVKRKHESI